MMEKFRNLSNNIFFKIFLGFLGLTFVMFGISGFILGGGNLWVAKVGNKTIGFDQFQIAFQNDKQAIYRSNNSPEALKYLSSDQFRQDVVGRMVTRNLIKSLQKEYQIYPNKDLILKEIVINPDLQTKDGKFNRIAYQNLLKANNLTEKQHIEDLSNEIIGSLIVQSLSSIPAPSQNLAKDLHQYRFQTRVVDLVTVSLANISNVGDPNEFELNDFFDKNKQQFSLPEFRKISFVSFGDEDLKRKVVISDEEIKKEYQNNQSDYQIPESRDFYHILFSDKKEADEFYDSLKSSKNIVESFIKKTTEQEKDKSAAKLSKIVKKDLPSEISELAFSVEKNSYSKVLKSNIGFHVFYLVDKNPASLIALDKVKNQIVSKLKSTKEDSQLNQQLKEIEDDVLATNSLDKVAVKFNLNLNKSLPKISSDGLDSKQMPVSSLNNLDDFIKNGFDLLEGKVSKTFFSKSNKKYYIMFVDKIEPKRQRSLDEVKVAVVDLWSQEKRQQKIKEMAEIVAKEINANGGNARLVAGKRSLKIESNHKFPRFYMIDAGNGKTVPYADKSLNDIFSLKIDQASKPYQKSKNEFVVAVVKQINNPIQDKNAVERISKDMEMAFQNDVLVSFNEYIKTKFPVEINQKIIENKDPEKNYQEQ